MYKYTHFIPENIAPTGAKSIGVYNGTGKRVGSIPLGGLTPPKTEKLYSFCALADVHITQETANADFQRALTYVENSDCAFTCIAGDLSVNGTANELAVYKNLVDTYATTKPVYAVTGNHENYSTVCKDFLQDYTGNPLYYSFTYGNDVFIMLGHYGGYAGDGAALGGWRPCEFMSADEIQWLRNTLEANKNRRCFIFTHVLPHEDGVGNPCGLYKTATIWYTKTDGGRWDNGEGIEVINLIKQYENVILFHGHSHMAFRLQELDKAANYSAKNGYKSVHIPSLASPRDVIDETVTDMKAETVYAESEGYIVDVYEDCIVLNGRDFIDNDADGHWLPIATYKIDTVKVESLLPTGYQQLDYIETTGTQYIDTGFVPNQDTRVICEFRHFDGSGIYGARANTSSKNFALRLASGNWQPAYGSTLGSTGVAADEGWHTAEQNKNIFYLDGVLMREFEAATFTAPKTFILGGINANAKVYYGKGHYRSCKLYDNGTLVRDLIPCTNPDGEIGMYDLVTEAFFGNSGTGSFVAG